MPDEGRRAEAPVRRRSEAREGDGRGRDLHGDRGDVVRRVRARAGRRAMRRQTVASFVFLAREGFFDGLTFHRIIPGFVIQGGDPLGDRFGRTRVQVRGRDRRRTIVFDHPGQLAMANSGPGDEREPVLRHARRRGGGRAPRRPPHDLRRGDVGDGRDRRDRGGRAMLHRRADGGRLHRVGHGARTARRRVALAADGSARRARRRCRPAAPSSSRHRRTRRARPSPRARPASAASSISHAFVPPRRRR